MIGRLALAGAPRLVLAGVVLAVAAVLALEVGGAGILGRLGALFGQGPAAHTAAVRAAVVTKPVMGAPLTRVRTPVRRPAVAPRRHVTARHRPPLTVVPQLVAPAPGPAVPVPTPAPPVPVVPAPPEPPHGVTQRVTDGVRQVAAAAPPAQGAADTAVGAVNEACGLIGGCP